MFDIVLYQPEIPPNTGNVMRLCANTGATLHLVEPLGFEPDDARLRRAGLDYQDWMRIARHSNWHECRAVLESDGARRIFALTTRASHRYDQIAYRAGDVFLFGPETRGLPQALLDGFSGDFTLKLPMCPNNRSLNLSNAVAVVTFEAWRQNGFGGAA